VDIKVVLLFNRLTQTNSDTTNGRLTCRMDGRRVNQSAGVAHTGQARPTTDNSDHSADRTPWNTDVCQSQSAQTPTDHYSNTNHTASFHFVKLSLVELSN